MRKSDLYDNEDLPIKLIKIMKYISVHDKNR